MNEIFVHLATLKSSILRP